MSEKSPHALQKANMRAFYAKQNIILAQPNLKEKLSVAVHLYHSKKLKELNYII